MEPKTVILQDLLSETRDGDWGEEIQSAGYIPYKVIRGTDFPSVRYGNLSSILICYISESSRSRRTLQANDIIIETAGGSREHPTGRTLLVTERLLADSNFPITCASFCRFLRVDHRLADPQYVYWYLQYLYEIGVMWQHQVQHTGLSRFQYTRFATTERIPVPDPFQQHAIVSILNTLDDKIELNRQMNKTLEAIAQALFRSWFVDFDPVCARMEGRQPYGMDAETAALFPDSFEDSPFGKIPRNWSVKPLSDCVSYLSRGVAPSYVQTSPIRALNQKAIRWWHIDDEALKFHNSAKLVRKEAYIRKGDVVINSTGDITIGRAYWFYHDIVNLFADSHVSIIRLLPDVLLPEVVVFQIETPRHQDLIYGHVTGSTGQLELNRSNLAHIPFLCPPIRLQWRFSEMVRPLFYLIWHDKEQSHILTTIRDTLLPKLLSGEMDTIPNCV